MRKYFSVARQKAEDRVAELMRECKWCKTIFLARRKDQWCCSHTCSQSNAQAKNWAANLTRRRIQARERRAEAKARKLWD
jgi:ribosomal protein S27AE